MGQSLSLFCDDCCKKLDEEITHHDNGEGLLPSNDDEDFFGDGSDLKTDAPTSLLQLYNVGKLVGSGATSNVYKALRKHGTGPAQVKLACKVIDKRKLIGMASQEIELGAVLSQLRKEIHILKRIDHPNIVGFHDFIETKDVMFLLMEYIAGEELFNYINRNGPLNEHLARQVMHGTLSAVSYLHDRGVLHRDIKTENIMICVERSPATGIEDITLVKLIDFGFSTTLKKTDFTGSFLGTDGYIAPEIRQQRLYNTSIDDWALGVLGFCILSGQLPFATSHDVLPWERRACSKMFKLSFPGRRWDKVSPCCKDLLSKLLEVDPLKRITAKQALMHPWFTPMQPKKRPIGSFNNLIATALANSHYLANPGGACSSSGVNSPIGHRQLMSGKRSDSSSWSDRTASTVDSNISLTGLVVAVENSSPASDSNSSSASAPHAALSGKSPMNTPNSTRNRDAMSMSQPLIDTTCFAGSESRVRTYSKVDDLLVDGLGPDKPLPSLDNPLRHVQSTSMLESSSDNYYSHSVSRSVSRANTPRSTLKKPKKPDPFSDEEINSSSSCRMGRERGVSVGEKDLSGLVNTAFADELNRSLISLSQSGSPETGPSPSSAGLSGRSIGCDDHYFVGSFTESSPIGLSLSIPHNELGAVADFLFHRTGTSNNSDGSTKCGTTGGSVRTPVASVDRPTSAAMPRPLSLKVPD